MRIFPLKEKRTLSNSVHCKGLEVTQLNACTWVNTGLWLLYIIPH